MTGPVFSGTTLRLALLQLTLCPAVLAFQGGTSQAPKAGLITFYGLKAVDQQVVFAVGKPGVIARSTDGGTTWILSSHPGGTSVDFFGLDFIDRLHGWIVGEKGLILATSDGGISWQAVPSGTVDNLVSVHFADSSAGWIAGFGGTILGTANGGMSWTRQRSGVIDNLWSISSAGAADCWVVGGSGTILATANGGKSWTAESSGVQSFLYSVTFTGRASGWTVGGYGALLKTTNGGATWFRQNLVKYLSVFQSKAFHYSIHAFDENSCILVGSGGTILFTGDGGKTWTPRDAKTDAALFGVEFTGRKTGWAAGAMGTIVKTSDGERRGNECTGGYRHGEHPLTGKPNAGYLIFSIELISRRRSFFVNRDLLMMVEMNPCICVFVSSSTSIDVRIMMGVCLVLTCCLS